MAWVSPQKLGELVSGCQIAPLLTELNDWSPGYGSAVAPHAHGAPVMLGNDFGTGDPEGKTSADIGADGGNVGLVDGSVSWRRISQMQIYRGSQLYEGDGCWAMW
jgi:hypothetical protein